ncbi:MAG TPA: sigma-70 family RNA polymerase sigma factor, partial [Lachnospiraceae bacterium]|nr:sigma-70 family RNA polymerase sigma factor [Lachnospiraceae bacterium]
KVLQNDQTKHLQEAINRLPFSEQQVIVMKFYNEMKLEDIADAMQCSRSSVKRYLINAKKNLQKFLQAEHLSVKEANS